MAENDGQEKTEQPTGKRIEDARKKGQVPRSKEVGTFAVLMSGVIGLWVFNSFFRDAFNKVFHIGFVLKRENIFDPQFMLTAFMDAALIVLFPVVLFGLFVIFFALIGNLFIGGFNVSLEAMTPKFNRLSPLSGIKRMFGVQSWVELLKSILKVVFIATCAYILVRSQFAAIVKLPTYQFTDAIVHCLYILIKIAIGIVCALIPIAAMDSWFQKWRHIEELKMTKQEVKDEYKETEGKPEVKSKIRQLQYQMATRRMMDEVPKADVVVTNPTHYAVALRYDQTRAHAAPEVVASGVDAVALKIREIAGQHNVTVVEAPPLARAIYYSTSIGNQIPEGLFSVVAQVLAFVFQLKMYKARRAGPPKPLPKEFDIPKELRHD